MGPRQLAHYCKLTFRQLLCWGPTPTCIACRNWKSNFSMLGPLTLIGKSLLQVHFRSVNYY
ncbi:hypothetical protein DQV39_04160 [Staphylococcus aureus]|nr:hypothetical protein RK72_008590 [Staphylococcus aureus]AVG50532.1 hypothetical protein RL06_11240 [Staphylococcus aureus]AVG68756.1 hypothetical protein RK60_03605 [Staphylococcus aureus]NAM17016.1 hypothetical protein [Staphylococcus aureus]NAM19921.1 hypothetical protein [Staphylococcus aureus]